MKSTISSKGQVTVPFEVRERLVVAGACVGVLVRKSSKGEHPVDRVFGAIRSGRNVDGLIDQLRGPRVKAR